MKWKPTIFFGVIAALGVVYFISIIPNFRQRSEWNQVIQALRGLPRERVDSAIDAFARAQKAQGRPVSDFVSLHELVAGGFLSAEEAAPFGGRHVTFASRVEEGHSQQIIARVLLRERVVELVSDGSLQLAPPSTLD